MLEILRITAPFGIRGAVRAILYTNQLNIYDSLFSIDGQEYKFSVIKLKGDNAILSLESITDRDSAEKLRGQSLYIKKEKLPELSDSKFYICDLIGTYIDVLNNNIKLKIVNVSNFGAGDLIEFSSSDNKTFYVPFTKENFPEIDGKMYLTEEAYNGFKN